MSSLDTELTIIANTTTLRSSNVTCDKLHVESVLSEIICVTENGIVKYQFIIRHSQSVNLLGYEMNDLGSIPRTAFFFSPPQRPDRLRQSRSLLCKHHMSYFFGTKLSELEANNSPSTSIEYKNAWCYTSTSPQIRIR